MPSDVINHPPLTSGEVLALTALIQAARAGRRARWIDDRGDISTGTVRHLTINDSGAFPGPDDDIRDCLLRITTSSGMEWFIPVTDAVDRIHSGSLGFDN